MKTNRSLSMLRAAAVTLAACTLATAAMAAGPLTIRYTGTIVAGDNAYAGTTVTLEPLALGGRVILKVDGHSVAAYLATGGTVRSTVREMVLRARPDGTAEIVALRDINGREVPLRLAVSRYDALVAANRPRPDQALASR